MKEFQELLGHVSALLDRQAVSLAEASAILARFIQGEMECSRLTVWALEGSVGQRVMRRIGGFDSVTDQPIIGPAVLNDAEFSAYFDALALGGVCVSDDTLADERLAAMRDSYLVPHDIRASLDAAIGINGNALGVLCCAQQGATRCWSQQEVAQLKRYADVISLRRARRRAQEGKTLTLMQELMQRVVEDSQPAGLRA
jgi:GAF domain-containing protein